MTGGYVLIAGILLYIFLLQKNMTPIKAALILVGGSWVLSSIVSGMIYASWDVAIAPNVFSFTSIITAFAQFAVAVGIFYKVEQSGDEYLSYVFWAGLGLAILFFIVPQLTLRFVGFF